MTKDYAPIAFFVYNRPEHTISAPHALKNNELALSSEIIIFSDAPKSDEDKNKVREVRAIINDLSGFKNKKNYFERKNFGLYKNFVDGITYVCDNFGKIIVVEDDNITSKYFFKLYQ